MTGARSHLQLGILSRNLGISKGGSVPDQASKRAGVLGQSCRGPCASQASWGESPAKIAR